MGVTEKGYWHGQRSEHGVSGSIPLTFKCFLRLASGKKHQRVDETFCDCMTFDWLGRELPHQSMYMLQKNYRCTLSVRVQVFVCVSLTL